MARPPSDSAGDGVFGDERLAGAGRCGDENGLAGVEQIERLDLERIEREPAPAEEGAPGRVGVGAGGHRRQRARHDGNPREVAVRRK